MDIEVYTFEDENGYEDDWHTQDASEAREYAQRHHRKWIANTFVFEDSELVEDYTEKGGDA